MAWLSRLRALFGRERLTAEHQEEIQFHLSMREKWNVEQGMAPEHARRDARLRFGNPSVLRERMREIDLMTLPESIFQDLRYGARMLWRNPVFTAVAVLALALGIGINTTFFTAYKAMIARSLDARDPGTMVNLALIRNSGDADPKFSYPDYEAYRDHLHAFSGLIAEYVQPLTLSGVTGGGQHGSAAASLVGRLGLLPSGAGTSLTEFANTAMVSENYFSVLGVAIFRGRTFESEDVSQLSASPAVLISENYWQRRFAGDPSILGKVIRLNGAAFTIIGITPHDFVGASLTAPDFWLPLSLEPLIHPEENWLHDRENQCCRLFGRLSPGVTIEHAQAEITLLADHLRTLHDPHSELGKPAAGQIWPGSPYPYKLDNGLKFAILLIMVAVGMVLVIACANVSSLQLARAASRQTELCMRLSLGASRPRLIRQLLTESALLALLAGGVALFFTWALLKGLVVMAAQAIPPEYGSLVLHVTPDLAIFAFVFAISLLAGVLFGLAPALESSRSTLFSAVNTNTGATPIRSRRLRDALMTIQVAVTLMLMIAGSMLIRSSIHALKMETGYDGKHVVDIEVQFPEGVKYTAVRQLAIVRELRAHLAVLPGVAAITTGRPPDGPGERTAAVSLNGEKPSGQNTQAFLSYTYVQPNYLQTLGIPLLSGRSFQTQGGQPEHSVILSESAAKTLWPGQNPIGRSLRLGTDGQFHNKNELLPDGPAYQVIGVARDTRGVALDGSDSHQVYVPLPEDRLHDHPILIRTYADPMSLTSAIRPVISSIDPNLVATSYTLEEILRQTPAFMIPSLAATIASIVGMFGLLLASMGIYGTVSYVVALRTREVGIRMALGAQKREILGLILRTSTRPVLAGLLAGVFLAVGASYLLRGVLYGLNPVDGIYFFGVCLLLLGIALFAAYLPSRRAMRVDPMVALRCE